MADTGRFHFTVTDAARMLGKAAVTIRAWERQELISLPRNAKGDRQLTANDVLELAQTARREGRIDEDRHRLVNMTMIHILAIERSNCGSD